MTTKLKPMFKSYLLRGLRFTTRVDVAKELSVMTGKPAISFISKRLRNTYLKAYPEMALTPDEQ